MATKTMHDLLITFMQDVYYAERQILKALPKMAKASQNEELKNALMHHREETQGQVDRLQKAFEALGKRAAWPDLRGDQRPDRRGRGGHRGVRAGRHPGQRHRGLRTGGRALRNGALRQHRRLGQGDRRTRTLRA